MARAIPQQRERMSMLRGGSLISEPRTVWIAHRDEMLAVINNWWSSHSFPLRNFKMTLLPRARRMDSKALIAQRLKRLSSIEAKLRRFSDMKLSQMQDIGGCRAVVENIRCLQKLVAVY
jgi:hypothetical protein